MTLQIDLPDGLALEAKNAGLLSADSLERWLRHQLKGRRTTQLFAAMDWMAEAEGPPEISPEEVAREIASMRAERLSR